MNRPPDRLSRPTAVIASSVGVLVYSGRMAEPICARLVTAAMKPIVETASAVYASPAQRYSTPASSSFFRCLPKASGSSRMPTTAPSFIAPPLNSPAFPTCRCPSHIIEGTLYLCRLPSPKITARSRRPSPTSSPSTRPAPSARGLLESGRGTAAWLLGRAGRARAGSGSTSPRSYGGSGFALSELRGRGRAAGPGGGAGPVRPHGDHRARYIAAAAPKTCASACCRAWPTARLIGAAALGGDVTHRATATASGNAGVVISGALADVLLVPSGDDVLVSRRRWRRHRRRCRPTWTRAAGRRRVRLDGARADVLPGARGLLTDIARTVFAAEAAGVAAACTEQASEYAKTRVQFGRPIATFQAVKHHCANMLVAAELATAAVWDAAPRRGGRRRPVLLHGGDRRDPGHSRRGRRTRSSTPRCTAASASPGSTTPTCTCAGRPPSRRSSTPRQAARDITDLVRGGRPPGRRDRPAGRGGAGQGGDAGEFIARHRASSTATRSEAGADRDRLRDAALAQAVGQRRRPRSSSWSSSRSSRRPGSSGPRTASPAGSSSPSSSTPAEDQVARWVRPALNQDVIWCQLFSEPGAGSDAAGIRTKATRADGGWLINGQKVWTSGAHLASFGLATVRTNPDAPKHQGITTMVIDMHATGVDGPAAADAHRALGLQRGVLRRRVRARRRCRRAGRRRLDGRPGDARQRERQHRRRRRRHGHARRRRSSRRSMPIPNGSSGGSGRVGRHIAQDRGDGRAQPAQRVYRAVAGGGPGPEGNIAKLVLSELSHEAAADPGRARRP